MIVDRNFHDWPITEIPKNRSYLGCNLGRTQPDMSGPEPKGVRLFPNDDTPRRFERCNLINCEVPPGSEVIDCNTAIIERDLPDFDEVLTVDGTERFRKTNKKIRVHGRYVDGVIERRSTPEEVPQ
jgi:hypothetical protein